MKKLLLIIFILNYFSIYSQNTEPAQHQFNVNGTSKYLSADSADFKQDNFLLGWHWCSGKSMTKALDMNQGHVNIGAGIKADTADLAENINLLVNVPSISNWFNWAVFSPLYGRSIKYEPTLIIDNIGKNTRPNDSSNAIFGFKSYKGYIDTNSTNENYNRLVVMPTYASIGDTVLSKPWVCNQFEYIKSSDLDTIPHASPRVYYRDYNCYEMYFTINLRRLYASGVQDTTKVLAIRMPYVTLDSSSGYIKFSELPSPTANDTIIQTYNRGKYQNLQSVYPTNTLYITKNMLPNGSDRDITISAKFICNGVDVNPHFKPGVTGDAYSPIDSLNIEVVYLDTTSIAIDWIKIETKLSQDLHKGLYDTLLIKNVQNTLDTFSLSKYAAKGIKLGRIYTIDETGDIPYWAGYRYINKLMGNIFTTEINPPFTDIYNYYVNPPDYIHSVDFAVKDLVAAPYITYSNATNNENVKIQRTNFFRWSYKLYGDADTLNSAYETFFANWNLPCKNQIASGIEEKIQKSRNEKFNTFPNPSANHIMLEYFNESETNVSLEIIDIFGQKVSTIIDNKLEEIGMYRYDFDTANLTEGIYFIVLNLGSKNYVKKLVVKR
ncbi:MAG: T9SS type A sorting domain-containing protein [Candidatus Kapabacteria bacterium]|nr:T9SS type A sorting domain-containing protein [Candidatus Kapabacteria bacterium]